MAHYIDKDLIVAEIERLIDEIYAGRPFDSLSSEQQTALWYVKSIMSSVNTLEVKEADIWHLQEKEDIYYGYISKTKSEPILQQRVDGEITIHQEGTNATFRIVLNNEDYNLALAAHKDGKLVKVKGVKQGDKIINPVFKFTHIKAASTIIDKSINIVF